jgi:hypothetical protein
VLAAFDKAGPFLIEIKVSKDRTLSFRPDYLQKLTDYAKLLGHPLLIAWKHYSVWCLFDARHLQLARVNFNITHSEAMRQNLLGVLAGDLGFALGAEAGVHFNCAKEELISTEGDDERFTESLTRNDHYGIQALASLRVSRRMWATKTQAVAEAMVVSKSLARRRQRPSQPKVRSTTHRRGRSTKPLAASDRLTISTVHWPIRVSAPRSLSPA